MTPVNVFESISLLYDEGTIPGWCPLEKAYDLAALVLALKPKVTVETGVFGGKSLLPMALACRANGFGEVTGIDPWSPQASTEGYTGENFEWWGKLNHEEIYQRFIANLARLDLSNTVKVMRAKSDDVGPPQTIDLLHLDSQHTEMALREVKRFGSRVRIGGIVVMDDLAWVNSGIAHVAQAVELLLESGFIELYRTVIPTGNWGVFQRVK